jgi:hypothetical protein
MSPYQDILVAFGGNATLLVVLGFLARSLMQTLLAKDIKRFEADLQGTATAQLERLKSDLKAQGDIAIEQLKSQLQQATIEHQIRFSKLHERRAEIIADLYRRIVLAQREGAQFVHVEGFSSGGEAQAAAQRKTQETMRSVSEFVEENRIYLPEQLCTSLRAFLDNMWRHHIAVGTYSSIAGPNMQTQEKKNEVLTKALAAFQSDIPAAKHVLEVEFRSILGAEASSPTPGREHPPF